MTDQVNMADFIAARSDQLNADDLTGRPLTIKITRVSATGSADQPVVVHYENEEGRPFKPCKTVRRIMVGVWGPDASKYAGRSMTLYRDPGVSFGGMQVGGIRVSHMSHIEGDKTIALLVTKGRKAPFTVKPLKDTPNGASGAGATKSENRPDPSTDAATKWANGYIAKLSEFTTIEALQVFAASKAAKLAELETARPDLHEKVTTALATRTADLKPAASSFDDDDFSTPSTEEPAAQATSDNQIATDEPHPAAAIADALIASFKSAELLPDLVKRRKDAELDIAAMPDEIAAAVESSYSAQLTRLKAPAVVA